MSERSVKDVSPTKGAAEAPTRRPDAPPRSVEQLREVRYEVQPRAEAAYPTAALLRVLDILQQPAEEDLSVEESIESMLAAAMEVTLRGSGLLGLFDDLGHLRVTARAKMEIPYDLLREARGHRGPFLAEMADPDDPTAHCVVAPIGPNGQGVLMLERPLEGAPEPRDALKLAYALAGLFWRRLQEPEEKEQMRQELGLLRHQYGPAGTSILASSRLVPLRRRLEVAAREGGAVFLHGEDGTEKEELARWLHQADASAAAGPFVSFYCGTVPAHRADEELLGGADPERGCLYRARGGTLFLDSPEKLADAVQSRLAGCLQAATNVRVVAASARGLAELQADGEIRDDLAMALGQSKLPIPPLRGHPNDITSLAGVILREMRPSPDGQPRTVTERTLQHLLGYPWPGNVRELRLVLESAAARAGTKPISPKHLPAELRKRSSDGLTKFRSLEEMERDYISQVLAAVRTKRDASKVLGIAPSTLYEKLRRYDIRP